MGVGERNRRGRLGIGAGNPSIEEFEGEKKKKIERPASKAKIFFFFF